MLTYTMEKCGQKTTGSRKRAMTLATISHKAENCATQKQHRPYLAIKRVVDFTFACILLLALSLPMLIIAGLIKIESSGPALFKQQRMGLGGKPFTIYKFRTMKTDAPPEMATLEFTDSSDYITRLGGFLRRTSIDELPQLFNIIKGDMSFVGYRPVCLTEENLNNLRLEYGVFALRPGITGLAQVKGRDTLRSPEKALLDKQYVEECSAKMDLWCCMKTVWTVLSGKGAI